MLNILSKQLTIDVCVNNKKNIFSFKEMAKVSAAQAVVDVANEVGTTLV